MDSGRNSHPSRILAVDDDPVSLAVAAILLEAEGCTVFQARSGAQALAMLPGCAPLHAIVADVRMDGLAGPALAAAFRQAAPGALLLAMSASPPPRIDGFHAVLAKPLAPEAVRAALALIPPTPQALPSRSASNGHKAGNARRVPRNGSATPLEDSPIPESSVLDSRIFNRLSRAMPAEGLREVVSVFLEDSVARLECMRVSDPETVRREAHTVKGGAAMLGAVQVASLASAVEEGIDHHGDRLRKLDELAVSLRHAEVILKQRLKI